MGMGHIYRMLSLASLLKEDEHTMHFLMPAWEDGINEVAQDNYDIVQIDTKDFENEDVYRKQLDIHSNNSIFDCIIVDALNVSENIMNLFSNNSKLLVSLDHVGSGRFYSDILLNVLYRTTPKLQDPIEYNGFEYLIVDNHFKQFNEKDKTIKKNVLKILIIQGGSDTHGLMPKIINDLNGLAYKWECVALIGHAFKHRQELEDAIKNSDLKITVLNDIKDPWKLFYDVDIAITGGGVTLFELLCVGTPCITLTGESKELETMAYLKDLTIMLGLYDGIQKTKIRDAVDDLIKDYEKRIEMSEKGKQMIDGAGAKRLLTLMYQTMSSS